MTQAIDKLPELTEKKKKIDMHVKMASKILQEIKSRQLDTLQDIEEELMTQGKVSSETKEAMNNFLQKNVPFQYNSAQSAACQNASFADKLRLLIILILCMKDVNELGSYIEMAEEAHKDQQLERDALNKINVMYNKKMVSD